MAIHKGQIKAKAVTGMKALGIRNNCQPKLLCVTLNPQEVHVHTPYLLFWKQQSNLL